MMHNASIGCTVKECIHHCKDDDFCSLAYIQVVKHLDVADSTYSTDCASFERE